MSSKLIDKSEVKGIPDLPPIGYYNKNNLHSSNENSASTIKTNLEMKCSNIGKGLFNDKDDIYNSIITDKNINLGSQIRNKCQNNETEKIKNQMNYLACQLASARSRIYNSSNFDITSGAMGVKQIFNKFGNITWIMILVFCLSIYFLIQGFFSSFDVTANLFNVINKNSNNTLVYYISLFLGISLPVIILSYLFIDSVCGNITNSEEKFNITKDPEGIKNKLRDSHKNLDYGMLLLLTFVIYAFVFMLFTFKVEKFGSTLYTIFVSSCLFIISILIYLFYDFIPFFSSADKEDLESKEKKLKLYVDDQDDTSKITTNQNQDKKIKKVFSYVVLFIFVFFLAFMYLSKKLEDKESMFKDILNGVFGASAILIVPIIWVINFILATQYFYIYPLIILGFRFLRYVGMGILFMNYNKGKNQNSNFIDQFSDSLKEQLDDFDNYSPSYNLVGIDVIKSLLNVMGYENIFSKNYINNNRSNNLSSNRYIIPGIFAGLFGSEQVNGSKKIVIQSVIFILTIVISYILLNCVYKI